MDAVVRVPAMTAAGGAMVSRIESTQGIYYPTLSAMVAVTNAKVA